MTDPLKRAASLAEQRIEEAMDRGEFDDLPGTGKPLRDAGGGYDAGWWARGYMERLHVEDDRHRRLRGLAARIDQCWTLARPEAEARFDEILAEWASILQEDPTLPPAPSKAELVTAWTRMYRAR